MGVMVTGKMFEIIIKFKILGIALLVSSCGIIATHDQNRGYSVGGMASGRFGGVPHFVILDQRLDHHKKRDQLLSYASYLLDYRGIPEVSIPEEADYFVMVEYVDSTVNSGEQYLQLTGFSKRVYNAIKEIRPSWRAISKHYGRPGNSSTALAKHVLSMRDVVGANSNVHQTNFYVSNNAPLLLDLYKKIEGMRQ